MTINGESTVSHLAAEYPPATRVFARHGIDFCCGGKVALHEVCQQRGLDTETVLDEIRHEVAATDHSGERWDEAPLGELIDHILATYHRRLDEELPRLASLARKVYERHRDTDAEMLSQVLSTYIGLQAELSQHMAKEEQILFPMIRHGQGTMAHNPISVMEHEHESAGAALARLRVLTKDYKVPAEACASWRALWHGLAALETELHEHIHLENNILFPRALAG